MTKTFTFGAILGLALCGSASAALVAHWELNGDAQDSSGNGYHLTTAGTAWEWVTDAQRGSVFRSTNSAVKLTIAAPNNSVFDRRADVTLAIWVKNDSDPYAAYTWDNNATRLMAKALQYQINGDGDNVRVRVREQPANNQTINANVGFNDGKWHHLVLTYDTNNLAKVYVDGGEVASRQQTSPLATNGTTLEIATAIGRFSDAMFYSHALSATDVQALYEAQSPQPAVIVWNVAAGDYGTASHWNPAQVPTSAEAADINNGGTAEISTGDFAAAALVAGRNAGDSGTLLVTGGSLALSGALSLGNTNGASGTLTVSNASVLTAKQVMVSGGGTGAVLLDGGTLTCVGNFDMAVNPSETGRSATLTIRGSSGTFSANNLNAGHATNVTLHFIADTNGFTVLNVANGINVTDATLKIDLDAYTGPTNTPLVLIDGVSLTGGLFGSVQFVGTNSAFVDYDAAAGNILLTWSDPGSFDRLPVLMFWSGVTGDFGDSNNWDKALVPMRGDDLRIDNSGTAEIPGGSYQAAALAAGRAAGGSGYLVMKGGNLQVSGGIILANTKTSAGTMTLTNESVLTAGGTVIVGARGPASVNVGSSARLNTGTLRLGQFGPEVNNNAAVGTVNLSGTGTVSQVIISGSGGQGYFNLDGGTLNCSGNVEMNSGATYTQRVARLTVNGSAGSFSAANLNASNAPNVTLDFVADAGGVTTLNIANAINIGGAALNVNLSAYAGTAELVLMDGVSLNGTFASVSIVGGQGAQSLHYDRANGVLSVGPPRDFRITSLEVISQGAAAIATLAFDSAVAGTLWFTTNLAVPGWTPVASGVSPLSHTNDSPVGFYRVSTP